jgi:hypothetical protein
MQKTIQLSLYTGTGSTLTAAASNGFSATNGNYNGCNAVDGTFINLIYRSFSIGLHYVIQILD